MNTLFFNAHILTMDDRFTDYSRGWLLVEGERIAALGDGDYTGSAPIDERIDCRGGILLPGFVNTHCHASMVPFRTMGDDCPDRLRRFLFPLETAAMTKELVYLSALYGIAEMLLRIPVITLLIPRIGFRAAAYAESAAWLGAFALNAAAWAAFILQERRIRPPVSE